MTTIAACLRERAMCADSMVNTGDTWWPCNKITEINDCLVGCAGEADQGKKFLKWFADQTQRKPKLTDAFCALVLTRTELHYYCSTLIPETIERGFHAVWSGGPIALGAMLAGKDYCVVEPGRGGGLPAVSAFKVIALVSRRSWLQTPRSFQRHP